MSRTSDGVVTNLSLYVGYASTIEIVASHKIMAREDLITIKLWDLELNLTSVATLGFDGSKQWSTVRGDDKALPKATTGICVFEAHPTHPLHGRDNERLALKLGHGKLAYECLLNEYDLYRNQLAPLQHDIVPICYGMFTNIHENNPDASYSCLVLDWYPENAPFTDSVDLDEDLTNEDPITQVQRSALKYAKVSKLRAVRKLHECGVLLGNLQDSTHFKINPHNGEVAVVGFGNAAARECTGSIWDTHYRAELDRFEKLYLDPMGQLPSMNEDPQLLCVSVHLN